jgi:type I restriction enzyme S subunit
MKYKLGEVISFRTGKLNSNAAVIDGQYPFFTCSPDPLKIDSYAFDEDCVLLAGNNANGDFNVKRYNGKFNAYQRTYVITAKDGADIDFLFYALKLALSAFKQMSQGTATKFLTAEILRNFDVDLPSPTEQRKIGRTLAALDAKIAANTAVNHNLEQMAQAIYADFVADAVGKTIKLGDICTFQEGYVNPPQGRAEYFDGDVKWLRAVDINESFIFATTRSLTKKGFDSAGKSALLFRPDTIAISKSGTIGRLGFVADFMCGNRAVINIVPRDNRLLPFVYLYLKSRQVEYPDLAVGSVQKNLYISILQDLDVIFPDEEQTLAFSFGIKPMFDQWKANVAENIKLVSLRDALLPRLMSGELPVALEI